MVLANKRVLIVEDNAMIGEVVAETIFEAGACPLGPVLNESEALDMICYNPGTPDAAVLDLGLEGNVVAIADKLAQLGVPFVFATGKPQSVPGHHAHRPICAKPYTPAELIGALQRAFAEHREAAGEVTAEPLV